jgi:glutamine cyclotransferase
MHDGWGLATDGEILYGSDGSSSLYHLDPLTFRGYFFVIFLIDFVKKFGYSFNLSSCTALKRVTVKYHDREIINLNELEYINGEIWANIWLVIYSSFL